MARSRGWAGSRCGPCTCCASQDTTPFSLVCSGPPGRTLPSQGNGQVSCQQCPHEASQGVQGHNERPHQQDQVASQGLASARQPCLIGEFLDVLQTERPVSILGPVMGRGEEKGASMTPPPHCRCQLRALAVSLGLLEASSWFRLHPGSTWKLNSSLCSKTSAGLFV